MLRILKSILREVQQIVRTARMKQQGTRQAKQLADGGEELWLDLGCGPIKRPGFVGIDLSLHADIQWDIRWGLPFNDNSVIEIRSDHFLEHLELPLVVKVLRECQRVLVSGGTLDFTVPHLDPYLDAYSRRDFDFLQEKIFDVPPRQEYLYNTCFDRIAWLLHRAGEHKSLFDRDSIVAKLRVAGFTDVATREFDPDRDTSQRFSSIYVVAIK